MKHFKINFKKNLGKNYSISLLSAVLSSNDCLCPNFGNHNLY